MTEEIEKEDKEVVGWKSDQDFVGLFVERFAPLSLKAAAYPRTKEWKCLKIPFSVTETRHKFIVSIEGQAKSFSNAWDAGNWILDIARRTRRLSILTPLKAPVPVALGDSNS